VICGNCAHPDHAHAAGAVCYVVTISGPASDKGRASKNGYRHTGRDVKRCDCTECARR